MRTIAEQWASYERDVLPATASATQRRETRRGFYAGAHALFQIIAGVGVDDVSVDQGADMLHLLDLELRAFVAELAKGRA